MHSLSRPYRLYDVVVLEATSDTPWHPPSEVLERRMAPSHRVFLGPGEIESFEEGLHLWEPGAQARPFRLRASDLSGRRYVSPQRAVCLRSSAPNSSSKPMPLRGTA